MSRKSEDIFFDMFILCVIVILCALGYWIGCHWWIVVVQLASLTFEVILFFYLARSAKPRLVWTQKCVVCGEVCGMSFPVTNRMGDFVCYNCREKKYRSLKQLREEYFPKTVERERLEKETPDEAAARIFKAICAEMMKK